MKKAPNEVVKNEKKKLSDMTSTLEKLQQNYEILQ
jgi:valyl-tRNA synthetase